MRLRFVAHDPVMDVDKVREPVSDIDTGVVDSLENA
jgi:hypothetical protein